ncbi:MAG TPA: MerR family transcriptional regulator [Kineosporiaceae bacterium]|nr:MerR family transcriptional regulator [Kineosporiaceae bacterium]
MGGGLLRIGELAELAGVSTRTVDFYTGLRLLVPAKRTSGNFRLYQATDVDRIGLIRRLEAHGIRLEDIARVLSAPQPAGTGPADGLPARDGGIGAGTDAGVEHLWSLEELEEQVRALREVTSRADPRALGVLATLTVRAQALIATAVLLGSELIGEIELPPM